MPGLFDDATDPYTQPQQQLDPSSLLGWLHSMLGNAGQQQQAEAGASQAMQPAVTGYLGDVASGQMAARAIPQDHYDPSRSLAQNALDPQALEQAQNIAMGFSGGGLGIKAYHGSPHDFDAFDVSKIGTGEGAQAFGHGLYFAEHEPVATTYRPASRPNAAALDALARDHFGSGVDLAALQDAWSASKTAGTDAEAAALMYMRNSALRPLAEGDPLTSGSPNLEAFAKRLREMPPPGKMYEVDINADPSQFLDWDKPTADQPGMAERIQRGGQYQPAGEFLRRAYSNPFYGGDLTFRDQATPAQVSAYLSRQGISGIRYLDQGSRGVGQGTRNYVVFDPEKTPIDILRKYAVPGLIAGGAAAGATSPGNNP